MLKLSWVSKLKPPVPKGEEPDEIELDAQYGYFKRRNRIANRIFYTGGSGLLIGSCGVILWASVMGGDVWTAYASVMASCCGLMALGDGLLDGERERRNQPLAKMSELDRADALRLIKFVPEARKLSESAREQGRSLRAFDLEAMRGFEKQRDAKRLKRESHRLSSAVKEGS